MNISGIIVRALPAQVEDIKSQMLALGDVEIAIEHDDGRMVVVIDESGQKRAGEALMKIQGFDGVLSANLVYQHSEEDRDDDDELIEVPHEAERPDPEL